ncbi:MAG: hypothetical protein WBO76_07365 [Saprospiraceae bacterium]
MKTKTLFVYLFLPFVLNCQIISKVELKFNGYYSFVKQNYKYTVNEYNTVYAYQLQTNGNLTDTGFSYKPIYGIVDPHNYLTYEPEIILRKFLFKERLDIGFKYGIKRTKIKHDFAINPLRARITAIVPMKVDQTIYYSSLGLQIAYYMPKIKSRIEIGIENSMPHKRIESSTRSITTDFRFYAFTVEPTRNFKHGGGIFCYFINYNYFITPHLFIGFNYKFSRGGDATDKFNLQEFINQESKLTHEGYYTNGLRLLGLNVGYSLNF